MNVGAARKHPADTVSESYDVGGNDKRRGLKYAVVGRCWDGDAVFSEARCVVAFALLASLLTASTMHPLLNARVALGVVQFIIY